MRPLENSTVTKGLLFAGCSFTWGQGLYYYSNLPSLKEPPPHTFNSINVKWSHYEYMKSIRYPRLIANHFKQFEVCQPFNGGTTYTIIDWWNKAFLETKNEHDPATYTVKDIARLKSVESTDWYHKKYDYEDFSHIFYQFTQWTRSYSPFFKDKNGTLTRTLHINFMQDPIWPKWLEENNITDDEYIERGKKQDIADVKKFLQRFEEKGVKAYVISWPFDMVPYIKDDPWLSERFIEFDYQDKHYTNIEHMMGFQHCAWNEVLHPELTIFRDIKAFDEAPIDHHPSPTCHRVIAENIIKRLEKEKANSN